MHVGLEYIGPVPDRNHISERRASGAPKEASKHADSNKRAAPFYASWDISHKLMQ
jgi:hypothetical protein